MVKEKYLLHQHCIKWFYSPVYPQKVISFKGTGGSGCQIVRQFRGHRDGVWEVSVSKGEVPYLGTASAGKVAMM